MQDYSNRQGQLRWKAVMWQGVLVGKIEGKKSQFTGRQSHSVCPSAVQNYNIYKLSQGGHHSW